MSDPLTTGAKIPAIIILTYNEELNLPHALQSVGDWSKEVFIVDSGSTDRTREIAERYGATFVSHPFESHADQRNWSIENIPFKADWALFLDADEQLTVDAKREIAATLQDTGEEIRGFYVQFLYYFLDVPLQRAMHPHLRLVRRDARWVRVKWAEFSTIATPCPVLKSRFIHKCNKGVSFLLAKFNRNSDMEARSMVEQRQGSIDDTHQGRRELKLRHKVWRLLEHRLPPGLRALAFFSYNILARFELRGGLSGLIFLFIYGLWYPLMIDAKVLELRRAKRVLA
jgi:glycosyltransferase involved in cell wall biosynthesis